MSILVGVISWLAVAALMAWVGQRLANAVKADGYGSRTAADPLRDWASSQLPSRPYSMTPPR